MKVSDFICNFLLENGINQCFSVTGGFAMHLNDSFGQKLDVLYQHGEGPCGYSAIGYSKMNNKPSVVCTTAGCGETNAVTPCLIAYQDSVPVFFISGGVPHKESIRWKRVEQGLNIRNYSGSDHDVVETVKSITKYAAVVWNPKYVKSHLKTCMHYLTSGRPGPVWLSVPLDIQSMEIEETIWSPIVKQPLPSVHFPEEWWVKSERPVILVGNGINLSQTHPQLDQFVRYHNVPVVSTYFGTDLVPEYNMGRVGILGDRTGNFTIQNADFVLNLGSQLCRAVIGYRPETFARGALILSINIEQLQYGDTLLMNLVDFFKLELPKKECPEWLEKVQRWKTKWSREIPDTSASANDDLCPYAFLNKFYNLKPDGGVCVASSGSIFCVNWHQFLNKGSDRFVVSSHGDMGFELPCAIGCAIESGKTVYCIVGDGSFQFNFQELQNCKGLPIKILYFNNGGYGAIQITQDNYFKRRFGVDMVAPDVQKICAIYDVKYFAQDQVEDMFAFEGGPCLIEVVCRVQPRYPILKNILKEDGTFENKPFEDMWPFLTDEEFDSEMCIKRLSN